MSENLEVEVILEAVEIIRKNSKNNDVLREQLGIIERMAVKLEEQNDRET